MIVFIPTFSSGNDKDSFFTDACLIPRCLGRKIIIGCNRTINTSKLNVDDHKHNQRHLNDLIFVYNQNLIKSVVKKILHLRLKKATYRVHDWENMPFIFIQIKVVSSSSGFIVINEQLGELKLTATASCIYCKSVRICYPHS